MRRGGYADCEVLGSSLHLTTESEKMTHAGALTLRIEDFFCSVKFHTSKTLLLLNLVLECSLLVPGYKCSAQILSHSSKRQPFFYIRLYICKGHTSKHCDEKGTMAPGTCPFSKHGPLHTNTPASDNAPQLELRNHFGFIVPLKGSWGESEK